MRKRRVGIIGLAVALATAVTGYALAATDSAPDAAQVDACGAEIDNYQSVVAQASRNIEYWDFRADRGTVLATDMANRVGSLDSINTEACKQIAPSFANAVAESRDAYLDMAYVGAYEYASPEGSRAGMDRTALYASAREGQADSAVELTQALRELDQAR